MTEEPKPAQIRAWVKRNHRDLSIGSLPVFQDWPKNLWKQKYDDIMNFLRDRFNTTLSEDEYYNCMLYLTKDIPAKSLYVPFKQSPQYKRMLEGEDTGIMVASLPNTMKNPTFSVKIQPFSVKIRGV